MNLDISRIEKQNEIIISLLGRIAFPEDELKKMITIKSKKPEVLLKAYNLCDGKTGLTEISKKLSVSQPALTVAINKWEEMGIVIKHVTKKSVFPQRIYKIKGV